MDKIELEKSEKSFHESRESISSGKKRKKRDIHFKKKNDQAQREWWDVPIVVYA